MLKRVLGIAAIVLVSNGLALMSVAANARGAAQGAITLTEREMRLLGTTADNSGMTLLLQWQRDPPPAWFDRAKLASIGFDCSIDPDAAAAKTHYALATLPRQTYVVLEYDANRLPDENPLAGPQVRTSRPREFQPRLRPVDIGNDALALDARYPDRHRYVVTAAVVAAWLQEPLPRPGHELRGRVVQVLPDQVYVPREWQATLRDAVGKRDNWDYPLTHPPRYQITLEYGRSLLPKMVAARTLAGGS